MMTLSVLGKTEQSVAGVGWAFNMVMAMLGGCMIPVMFMPAIFQKISVISPVRWAILGIEGAIWRDFSWSELFLPMAIMVSVGVVGFTVGTTIMMRRNG
jgi:ABC-2 type transport system permease protein